MYDMKVVRKKHRWPNANPIGLYRENAIAIESEARDPNGTRNLYSYQCSGHMGRFKLFNLVGYS